MNEELSKEMHDKMADIVYWQMDIQMEIQMLRKMYDRMEIQIVWNVSEQLKEDCDE